MTTVTLSDTVEIPWNRLRKGKHNVRVVSPHNAADQALIANIGETATILENLIVTPSKEEGCFDVHAGARRWSAVGVNIKNGVLDDSFPMPCRIQTAGSLSAVSLAENLQAPMHPADECEAFQTMLSEGMNQDSIALHFGLPKKRVAQRLKIAQVAPKIIKAYRAEQINLETVMAFTLADTKKKQIEVFAELGEHCNPYTVRRAMTNDGERSDSRLAKYVGVAAYTKAGGQLITDLFSEYDHLADTDLLQSLALEKLEKAAARLTAKEGWKKVQVSTEAFPELYKYHRIEPDPIDVPEKVTRALTSAIADQNVLNEDEEDWTEEKETKFDALTETIGELEDTVDRYRQYSDEDKTRALCFITVNASGRTEIARGYVPQSQAKQSATVTGDEPDVKKGMPQALVDDLGVHRQQIAKAALLDNPALASDVLLYTLCRQVLNTGWDTDAIDARFDPVVTDAPEHQDSPAGQRLNTARGQLVTEWLNLDSPAQRFAALRKLTSKRKEALQTYCVSALLTVKLNTTGNDTIPEAVLADLAPDYALSWRPTGEAFFKRLTKPTLLALGQEFFGDDWAAQHARDKKTPLVGFFDEFFNGKIPNNLDDQQAEIRENWLPNGFVADPS